jgi:hypothetical protein
VVAANKPTNENALPDVGEAYALVNLSVKQDHPHEPFTSPYHAAAVVAKDGNDRVTIEVFARAENAKYSATGSYKMYGAGKQSFHDYWVGEYYRPPANPDKDSKELKAVTFVLEARPIAMDEGDE